MSFTKSLPDDTIHDSYDRALTALTANARVRIGQIDTGLTRHPALGFEGDTPPQNVELRDGFDFIDRFSRPVVDAGLKQSTIQCILRGGDVDDCLTDYPDHGTKTLSVILSNNDKLKGVAPGARIVPVRIADGPVFENATQRDNMGRAMKHLLDLPEKPRVITISMGNPGHSGPLFQPLFSLLGAPSGFNRETEHQFQRAYEMGVIVCCAAGQVIDRVIKPALYPWTIAVGGFFPDRRHYPLGGYDNPDLVDVWAQAAGINRAVSFRDDNGTEHHVYAEDEANADVDDVSGTSYATPQVAAAAALWVETFWDALPPVGAPDAWKTVEAFREAVVASAHDRALDLGSRHQGFPCLYINRLVDTAPDLSSVQRR